MKKILIFAVVLSLLVPAAAFAAAEFSLGGFIKLDSFWDSGQSIKNMYLAPARSNDPNYNHGEMVFTAQGSRFNFTIKGPKLWGAQTTGFMEMDFDPTASQAPIINTSQTASNSYTPRLRHAMFRLNWPETELLFGQYWSMFCDWYAEAAEDGPFQTNGTPTARLAQIRLTQKFAGDWSIGGLIGEANQAQAVGPLYTGTPGAAQAGSAAQFSNNGVQAETPQIQGQIKYAHDWWGKAAYYGVPRPFTASVTAAWQRNVVRPDALIAGTNIQGVGSGIVGTDHQYFMPWLVMGSLFIPVIPTHSANLAGTAHILTQWWIGQGAEAFGFAGMNQSAVLHIDSNGFFDVTPLNRWGGFIEAQYYFTNEWFLNAAYAVSRIYGLNQRTDFLSNVNGQVAGNQQVDATLWYRPIQALKFGLQYSYAHGNYLARLNSAGGTVDTGNGLSNSGNEHRVEFVGYFFF